MKLLKKYHSKYILLYKRACPFILALLVIGLSDSSAQIKNALNPDSLMNKVETFGTNMLSKPLDTTYIESYPNNLALKLLAVNKINYFRVVDRQSDASIRYRPDRRLNLGAGISYKWFALDLTFNVGIDEGTEFQNENMFDFQGSIFNNKQYISVAYQYYYGYQSTRYKGIPATDYPVNNVRDDIRTIAFSLNYSFAFNYDKFSLKASFIQNEIQLKSAGSFLIGASFNMFDVVGDSSVIPSEMQSYFNPNLYLTDLNSTSLSVNFGYMYTFVWKRKFYITLSLIPGAGLNMGDYKTVYRSPYQTHAFFSFSTLNTIGFNAKRIFGGLSLTADAYTTRVQKQQNVINGHGKFRLFFGYRFKTKSEKNK